MHDTPIYLCHPADHGGLAGLTAATPRLAALGVGALLLRPVHQTANGHILDLEQIDPALGDTTALRDLVTAAHDHGLRVLLDLELRGCAAESRYLIERPEWFARDEGGAFIVGSPAAPAVSSHPGVASAPGCYNFDWNNDELRSYLLSWALAQADAFALDGFRAVAPYSPPLAWSRRTPLYASDGALAPLAWLHTLRTALSGRSPDLALIATLSGPAFGTLCDGLYDYPVHLMFVHAALRRATGHELGAYLDDVSVITPPGVARISFMESHDTCELNPLADGLRGSRLSRMLQAAMILCGFVPSLWSGQEQGEEHFLGALLALWRTEATLRHGTADFMAARCASPDVLAVLREQKGRRLLGLMHTGPCPVTTLVSLPMTMTRHPPRDLLAMAPLSIQHDQAGLHVVLAPFSTYCLELDG